MPVVDVLQVVNAALAKVGKVLHQVYRLCKKAGGMRAPPASKKEKQAMTNTSKLSILYTKHAHKFK